MYNRFDILWNEDLNKHEDDTDSKNYQDLTKVKYSNQNQEKNMSKHIKNEDKNEDNKEKNAIINDNITVIIEQHKTNELLLQCNTISQYN